MLRNKKLVAASLVVVAMPLFAACGGNADPTVTSIAPTMTTGTAAQPTTAAAPTTAMTASAPTAMMIDATATTGNSGGTTGTNAGVFSWRAYAEPETMDPALMQENLSIDLAQNVYDALTEFNPETSKLQPALAKSWDVSSDATVYTFHLREDAKFSNGDPVTADDFVYSYNRAVNNKEAPYTDIVMNDIKGYDEVRASATTTDTTKPKVDKVSGIEATDPHTLKITLKAPSAYFISQTTVWTYYVVNKKVVETGADWLTKPGAGTGAYILTEWKHNESLHMKPNPNYWGDPKPTVEVNVPILKDTDTAQALFEKGQLSVLDGPDASQLDRIKKDAKFGSMLHSVGQARSVWVGLNVMKAPFGPVGDPKADKLRQAFAMSIDRQQLSDLALSGSVQPLTTLLPQGEPGSQKFEAYKFDAEAAKKLLADAGAPNCEGLNLTYTYRQRDAEKSVAEQLQQQWKQNLGCDIKIEGVEWKNMLAARQNHEYTMFYGSWGHDYPDPQNWLYALFHSSQIKGVGTGSGNDPGWSNKDFDTKVVQANTLADPAKQAERYKLYNDAEQTLLKEAPMIPLYQATRFWEARPEFTGYGTNASFIYPFKMIKAAK